MTSVWKWNLRRFGQEIWVPITAYAVLGLATALGALLFKPLVPEGLAARIGADAVSTILQILASSMLSVTTFSLSIMLAAFASASGGATPRATALLKEDEVSRSVLATFVGVFIFSLTSLIGLQTGIYENSGRLVLFVVTIAVVAAVIVQLVRWIGHLAHLGRLGDTLERIEASSAKSLAERMALPYLGAHPLDLDQVPEGVQVSPARIGYLQMIDVAALDALAARSGRSFAVLVLPGAFVHPAEPLVQVIGTEPVSDDLVTAIRALFVIDDSRTFAQDPRFGVLVLAEVASRALSPAVNDPGTAIDILGRLTRVLSLWQDRSEPDLRFAHLQVPGIKLGDLMTDAFAAIARDGAGIIEVQIRIQKTLAALAGLNPAVYGAEALRLSTRALLHAEASLPLEDDRAVIRRLNADLAARIDAARIDGA